MEYEVVAKDFEKKLETSMPSHKEALELVISHLIDKEIGVISSVDEIDAIGHRVVHGGEEFANSVLINDQVLKAIEANNDLAPLHNPANLSGGAGFIAGGAIRLQGGEVP